MSSKTDAVSVTVPDLGAFAHALRRGLAQRQPAQAPVPGQVETLNLIAHALGQRNLQALQASLRRVPAPVPAAPEAPLPLSANARKALMQFDGEGRLMRWPVKFSVQRLAMWVLWLHFDGRRRYTEAEVNTVLRALNAFGDHVTLRRELVNHRLLTRKSDCSEYRKLPARPDAEARAMLHAWRQRARPGQASRTAPGPG